MGPALARQYVSLHRWKEGSRRGLTRILNLFFVCQEAVVKRKSKQKREKISQRCGGLEEYKVDTKKGLRMLTHSNH